MRRNKLNLQANCKTTAMGIMPHTSVERALGLALSLDVPFWPQLPNVSFYEDMYVQAAQNFPGIVVDPDDKRISFDIARFEEELVDYSQRMAEPETFALSQSHSLAYPEFITKELQDYAAIRGQVAGPISLGFRVIDEDSRPIIYNDEVRTLLFDFIQRKANTQYRQLREKNQNAFVWLDEPGLLWVFSGLSGYNDVQARQDYTNLLDGFEGPRVLHLCPNVNLPYLLGLGVELLSFDSYQIEFMPKEYANAAADFLRSGGIISWGIVPTESESLSKETPETLARLLLGYWEVISLSAGLSVKAIAEQALIAPARCCIRDVERVGASDGTVACKTRGGPELAFEEQLVERAFAYLTQLSGILKDKFGL